MTIRSYVIERDAQGLPTRMIWMGDDMKYRINRPDNGSKELIAYAKSIGFDYEHLGGSIDGALALGSIPVLVEWKSKGGTLTPTQQRLVARGFPVRFVQTPAQLDAIKAELSR